MAYFKPFSSVWQGSSSFSSLSRYTIAYVLLLLGYFSHLPFHPCCSFKKFQLCITPFLGPARSVPPLLLIATDDALKTVFFTFIIITSLLSSLLELTLGLCITQLPNFSRVVHGRTVSTGTSVAMFIHPSTLQLYLAPSDRSSRQHCSLLRISNFMLSSGPPLLQCVLWAGVRRHNRLCAAQPKEKPNPKPIQRCCKVVSSLLSAYKLIFSFQCWVHVWNGDGFSSKKCSVILQTHLCESTLSFQSEFHSMMTCHVHVLSFEFLLLAMRCGKSWVTDSCSPAPSHSWIYMLAPYHLVTFSFPTPRALLRLPGSLLHLQELFSYSAIFFQLWTLDMRDVDMPWCC